MFFRGDRRFVAVGNSLKLYSPVSLLSETGVERGRGPPAPRLATIKPLNINKIVALCPAHQFYHFTAGW